MTTLEHKLDNNQNIPLSEIREQAEKIYSFLKNLRPTEISFLFFLKKLVFAIAVGIFNKEKKIPYSSIEEIKSAFLAFGTRFEGIDLYSILGDLYNPFHAFLTGRTLENLESYRTGLFLGFPVYEIPQSVLTDNTIWYSQDYLGRRRLVRNILQEISSLLKTNEFNEGQKIYVIDYAGGLGNLTEALFEEIDTLNDENLKKKVRTSVRVIIRDSSEEQIKAGEKRFNLKYSNTPYKDSFIFVISDITKKLEESSSTGEDIISKIREKWSDFDISNFYTSVKIGMMSYAAGALPTDVIEELARRISEDCKLFFTNDFSSPKTRLKEFLKQTKEKGELYLRLYHPEIFKFPLNLIYGVFSLVNGLRAQYETWPGTHKSGYTRVNGKLVPPNILVLEEKLREYNPNSTQDIQSTVNSFMLLSLGEVRRNEQGTKYLRVIAIPGWVDDLLTYKS
ncbi:MAG: hypothetical protein QW757_05870 [Candidatus Woesearchaeota archaeon]